MATKVRFLKAYTTRVGNPYTGRRDPDAPERETYAEGEEVDFLEKYAEDVLPPGSPPETEEAHRRFRAEQSSQHFINRGVAEAVVDDKEREARQKRGRTAPPAKAGGEGEADHDEGGPRAQKPTAEAEGGYESKTVEELHAEATSREIEGRSGMSKADLVKALVKDDRAKARAKENESTRRGPQAK